jgi:hypothetical protein
MASYKPVAIDLKPAQFKALVAGKPSNISNEQIGHGKYTVLLHPLQEHKMLKAKRNGKGHRLQMTKGELHASHESDLEGTGFFSDIGNWFKNNASTIMDGIAGAAKAIMPGSASTVDAVRGLARAVTGKGMDLAPPTAHTISPAIEAAAAPSASYPEPIAPKRALTFKRSGSRMYGRGLYL